MGLSKQKAWYDGWAVVRKKAPGRGWWAPPKGTHGQGKGNLGSVQEAIKHYIPSVNRETFDMSKGLSKAKDEFHSRADIFMYNPSTRTLLVGAMGAGDDHPKIQQRYAKGQDFDEFVKMRYYQGKLSIYVDRVVTRSEKDAWDKSFQAARVVRACGMPGDTLVRLLTRKSSAGLELGEV